MRPIDADTIFPKGQVLVWEKDGETTANYILKLIKDAPTLDVEPVRHGRWKDVGLGFMMLYVCTHCGKQALFQSRPYQYCPNCGAKMDAKEAEG